MTKKGKGPAQVNCQGGGARLSVRILPWEERSVCAANDEQSDP